MSSNTKKDSFFFSTLMIISVICVIVCCLIMAAAKVVFADEFIIFFNWWFVVLALGVVFMPFSMLIFNRFSDLGWLFSKVIGIAVSGWLVWYMASMKILRFTRVNCILVIVLCLLANICIIVFNRNKFIKSISSDKISHIVVAETVFLAFFVFWLYLRGFNPKAYGTTEKLMDLGIMQSILRSEYMPPQDMWLAGENLNYYYVGQFMASYLSRVCNCGAEYGYNFMLMMLAAFGFALPASLVFNVSLTYTEYRKIKSPAIVETFATLAAAIAGTAVSLTGNMHYVIYAKIVPWVRNLLGLDKLAQASGYSFPNYWFPDATRYIGYNPETTDKTIHEFPLYSFVLGDLHAHVINIMFVLTVVAILYAFLLERRERMDEARISLKFEAPSGKIYFGIPNFFAEVFNPCVVMTGFFIGLFHTTNFWDFPIYFVVAGAVILFSNCVIYNFSVKSLILTAFHAVVVLVVSKLICLPFSISFNQISSSIGLCDAHTSLFQLIVLWGLPLTITFVYLGTLIRNQKDKDVFEQKSSDVVGGQNALFRFIGNLEIPDMFILVLGLCAFGLVLLPELIYVRDIYAGSYKRANTMFKLSYQAFILFGLTMGFVVTKLLFFARFKRRRVFAVICIALLIWSCGYFGNSTKAWFGNWTSTDGFKGLNAGEYLTEVNIEDYNATNWLMSNLSGQPVVLEANGDSYTDYCRVSARTGFPTILGWKTHEWLWQSDSSLAYPEKLTKREEDVSSIYTSSDAGYVQSLLSQYNVEYIYVGGQEREKFGSDINYNTLLSVGSIVYPYGNDSSSISNTTFIIRVHK